MCHRGLGGPGRTGDVRGSLEGREGRVEAVGWQADDGLSGTRDWRGRGTALDGIVGQESGAGWDRTGQDGGAGWDERAGTNDGYASGPEE